MDTTLLGSMGVGLVWGWLLGRVADTVPGSFSNVLFVLIATSLVLLEVYWLASWSAMGISSGALVLSFLLHLGWRRSLRQRFDQPT